MVLFMVRLFKLETPKGIVIGPALVPPKTKLEEVVVVNVPVPDVAGPFKVSVLLPTANEPLVKANVPAIVIEELSFIVAGVPLVLFMVRLFKLETPKGMATGPASVPPKTRLEEVVVVNVPVPVVDEPFKLSVLLPTAKAPVVKASAPVIIGLPVKVKPSASFNSRLPKVAPEMEDETVLPPIEIFPAPECVPVPVIFPFTVNVNVASVRFPFKLRLVTVLEAAKL